MIIRTLFLSLPMHKPSIYRVSVSMASCGVNGLFNCLRISSTVISTLSIPWANWAIEFLSFENHTKRILQLGKGYGESEIIKYALKHSKILNQHEYFVKCTAKLWVSNFNKINTNFYNYSGLFRPYISYTPFKPPKIEYIDTRFYITHKDFYLRYLNNLYDYENFPISIEELFLKKFLELNVKKIFFYSLPVISGVSGGSGKEYNTKLYRVVKDKIRYQIWRNSKFMKDYFIS